MVPDFEAAKQYALRRLENDLIPNLAYHSLEHTRDDIVPATKRLAERSQVSEEQYQLLVTAAWFHDIGFVERYQNNEIVAKSIAEAVLPDFGFSTAQVNVIGGCIMATKLPQNPKTLLEQIMADADLDNLGREDFFVVSDNLRLELLLRGERYSARDWYEKELRFLTSHQYFTPAARALRDEGKRRNAAIFRELLHM
jgi:uncharacterized protein